MRKLSFRQKFPDYYREADEDDASLDPPGVPAERLALPEGNASA